jgi:hypothetical protein
LQQSFSSSPKLFIFFVDDFVETLEIKRKNEFYSSFNLLKEKKYKYKIKEGKKKEEGFN